MLSLTCKTGIKAVIYLASKFESGENAGIKEIAKYIDASEHTVGKLLQTLVKDARASLEALKPEEVNALEGKDVTFSVRDMKMPFKAEGFLQTFSLPNFHFHATTAYDILRHKGVPLGKRDYMGRMKLAK